MKKLKASLVGKVVIGIAMIFYYIARTMVWVTFGIVKVVVFVYPAVFYLKQHAKLKTNPSK